MKKKSSLSLYEMCILIGLEQGRDLKQIARDLEISLRTTLCFINKLLITYECQDINGLLNYFGSLANAISFKEE